MLPKSRLKGALTKRVSMYRNIAPMPRARARITPVATSRSRARVPSAPTPSAAATQKLIRPQSAFRPSSEAPAPPVKPMSVTACPMKERPRNTTK